MRLLYRRRSHRRLGSAARRSAEAAEDHAVDGGHLNGCIGTAAIDKHLHQTRTLRAGTCTGDFVIRRINYLQFIFGRNIHDSNEGCHETSYNL